MSEIVSNENIINIFKEIDELKIDFGLNYKKITEKRQEVVEKLSFLVYSQAKQYRGFPNYNDLAQEGFVGLVKAAENFKWELFPNFFIYSGQWIRHYIKRAASRFDIVYNPNRTRVIYSEPSESEVDLSCAPDEILFAIEREECITNVLRGLPKMERDIVNMIFGLGGQKQETLRKIGPKFNLSHERIRQIKNNILNKLKRNQKMNELNRI